MTGEPHKKSKFDLDAATTPSQYKIALKGSELIGNNNRVVTCIHELEADR